MAVVVGPGYLMIGRRLEDLDAVSRFCLSYVSGLFFCTLCCLLFSFLNIPCFWWAILALAVVLSLVLGQLGDPLRAVTSISKQIKSLGLWDSLFVLTLSLLFAAVLIREFQTFVVPPGVYDASNHSYLALRLLETRSVVSTDLFTGINSKSSKR